MSALPHLITMLMGIKACTEQLFPHRVIHQVHFLYTFTDVSANTSKQQNMKGNST